MFFTVNIRNMQGQPQLTHPPQFGTSGTVTHWFTIDTPLIWNVRVCDTVLMIWLLHQEIRENMIKCCMTHNINTINIPQYNPSQWGIIQIGF